MVSKKQRKANAPINEQPNRIEEFGVFIPAPYAFVFDLNLSAIELRVLLIILGPYFNNAPSFQSHSYLARKLNISKIQITRIMKALKEKGYIKEMKCPGHTSTYTPQRPQDIYPFLIDKKYLNEENELIAALFCIFYYCDNNDFYIKHQEMITATLGKICKKIFTPEKKETLTPNVFDKNISANNNENNISGIKNDNTGDIKNDNTGDIKNDNTGGIKNDIYKNNKFKNNKFKNNEFKYGDFSVPEKSCLKGKNKNQNSEEENMSDSPQGPILYKLTLRKGLGRKAIEDGIAKTAVAHLKTENRRKRRQEVFGSGKSGKEEFKGPEKNYLSLYKYYVDNIQKYFPEYFDASIGRKQCTPKDAKRLKEVGSIYGYQEMEGLITYTCKNWDAVKNNIFYLKEKKHPLLSFFETEKTVDELFSVMSHDKKNERLGEKRNQGKWEHVDESDPFKI